MKEYLLAIDAGTGSIRAVIFDLDGNQIAVGQHEWFHKEDPRYPGSMDFEIESNFELMVRCIREAVEEAGIDAAQIIAVSSCSMREGIVLYDAGGKEIWACANVDARADREVEELSRISEGIEHEIYERSGQTFSLGAIARILWVKNKMPRIYENVKAVTMLNDWICYRLSGVLSVEPSNGCTTGMFALGDRGWDSGIARRCGLKEDIYPRVFESGTAMGKVTAEISALTGLSRECKVVAGGGDAQIGTVGVGAVREGQMVLFGGSFWQLEYNTGKAVTDPEGRVRVNCHVIPDQWQHEMIAFFPGLIMRWFRDAFCQLEKLMEEETGIDAYVLLDRQAADVPAGSNGLLCSFSSVQDYSNWKHGAPCFTNFSLDPDRFNKGSFFKALMENAALVTLGHLKILKKLNGLDVEELIFASGASKSPLWCQIVSDVLGVRVKVPVIKEAAALGTAFCAGKGVGRYSSIEDAAERIVAFEKTYEPDRDNHRVYEEIFGRWIEINRSQMEQSDRGLISHMWKAPGL